MEKSEITVSWYEYEQIINNLKEIPSKKIEETAKTLEDLNFTFTLGNLDVDLFRMTKKNFLQVMNNLKNKSVSEVEESPSIFDPPQNHSPSLSDWAEAAKLRRAEVLVEKFLFLHNLREDIPEAWDEVNELFYDD